MSLRLWLPLNGNLDNQGLSDTAVTNSGTTVGNVGKLGKCCAFDGSKSTYLRFNDPFTSATTEFSIAMWVRTSNSVTACLWNGRTTTGKSIALFFVNSKIRFDDDNQHAGTVTIATNTWYHIACTYQRGGRKRIYVNGVLDVDAAASATLSKSNRLATVGLSSNNDASPGGNPFTGYINDLRAYDHCLSPKDVHDLAAGLAIHYKLDGNGIGNPNLFTWSKNYTEDTPYVHTSSAADGLKYMGNDTLVAVTPGKSYYIQMKSDRAPKASHGGGGLSEQFTLFLYVRNIGSTKGVGSYDRAVNLNSSNIYLSDPSRQFYVWKYTATANDQDLTFRSNTYSDGTTKLTLNLWDIKIEEGSLTCYTPGVNEPRYALFGLGTGVENDCSGFGNDGRVIGTAVTYLDTRRYERSTYLDSNSAIVCKNLVNPDRLTINVWHKGATGNLGNWEAGGGGIYTKDGKWNCEVYVNGAYRVATGGTTGTEWQMITMTYDGRYLKLYVDSALAATTDCGNYPITYHKSAPWTVNGNPDGSGTVISSRTNGYWSDFRLYATALSADDIYRLYRCTAVIDKNGDVMANEFKET